MRQNHEDAENANVDIVSLWKIQPHKYSFKHNTKYHMNGNIMIKRKHYLQLKKLQNPKGEISFVVLMKNDGIILQKQLKY